MTIAFESLLIQNNLAEIAASGSDAQRTALANLGVLQAISTAITAALATISLSGGGGVTPTQLAADIAAELAGYVTEAALATALENYSTPADFSTALSTYATTTPITAVVSTAAQTLVQWLGPAGLAVLLQACAATLTNTADPATGGVGVGQLYLNGDFLCVRQS